MTEGEHDNEEDDVIESDNQDVGENDSDNDAMHHSI